MQKWKQIRSNFPVWIKYNNASFSPASLKQQQPPRPQSSLRSPHTRAPLDLTSAPLISRKQLVGVWRHRGFIRTTSHVLPSPPTATPNLEQRLTEKPSCPLHSDAAAVKHGLSKFKAGASQGRYTWRHNQVLKCPAGANES